MKNYNELYKYIVKEVYQKYNPEKTEDVSSLFEKYKGKEKELTEKVCKKYHVPDNEVHEIILEYRKNFTQKKSLPLFTKGLWILVITVVVIAIAGKLYNVYKNKEQVENINTSMVDTVGEDDRNKDNYGENLVSIKKGYNEFLFHPDSVMDNRLTELLLKEIIQTNNKNYKIEKIMLWNGEYSYSIEHLGANNYCYSTKTNSYQVDQFAHWANINTKDATDFYKKCGFHTYKNAEDVNSCIRLKDENESIFIQITEISSTSSLIVISDIELSDELDV